MAERKPLGKLKDNLEWICSYTDSLESYIDYFGRDEEKFMETEMFQDACYSKINQIVQCVLRIQEKYPEIYEKEFRQVFDNAVGMRNIIIHQYENTFPDVVWESMITELPQLRTVAARLLKTMSFE